MPDLEAALAALARQLEFPPEPDLAPRVRARLAAGAPQRAPLLWRRTLGIALVVLAVALGAVMAVPQTRAALLELFGLRGVAIERVERLPAVPAQAPLALGERVELGRVEVPYEILVPRALGEPDAVFYRPDPGGGMLSFLYGTQAEPRAILTVFSGSVRDVIYKGVGPETVVEPVEVEGEPGYWLTGEPHAFAYLDREGQFREETLRLAGSTLLWERGGRTFRLEAGVTKAQALEIASSLEEVER